MRIFKRLVQLASFSALSTLLLACSGTPAYDPTTFKYQVDEERFAKATIKTVIIPHINLGGVSRKYLEKEAPRIDGYVSTYLKENGFKVLPQREFKQYWNTAVRIYGNPVDPTSGKVNMRAFSQIMQTVRNELAENSDLDAFVFTDLVELKASFSGGMKHQARWDGVSRKPTLEGPGTTVAAEFDWSMQAAVASIQVTLFDMELQRLFLGRGGMDTTEGIDTRSSKGRYIRRRNILENKNFVMEGIQLAFHPFIEWEDWPGTP